MRKRNPTNHGLNLIQKRSKLLSNTSNNNTQNNNKTTPKQNKNIAFFNLDLPEDKEQIYNPKSRFYCKEKIENIFTTKDYLPYSIENHVDQANYIYHVVMNLYISIASLDIQGLISISPNEINNMINNLENQLPVNMDNTDVDSENIDEDVIDDDDMNNEIEEYLENEGDMSNEDDYLDTTGPNFSVMGKITNKSSSIINVNHWTNELKNCLNFPLPLTLRKSLVIVYYYLALTQGQKIYRQLYVEILELLIDTNEKGNNFTKLLQGAELKLDYKPLFEFLCEFLPYPDSDYVRYDIQSKDDLQLYRLLLKLAHISRPFYPQGENILNDSMSVLLTSLSPLTMSIVLPMMTSFIPFHFEINIENSDKRNNVIDYFPFCFSVWTSVSPNVAVDTHIYDFVGSTAENFHSHFILSKEKLNPVLSKSFNEYGLFTKEQLVFLFNRLQGHLRSDGQIHSYSRTVKPFIYSINGGNSEYFFHYLVNLINSIETYVHPSNNGMWTRTIAKFIHGYIKMHHKRWQSEQAFLKANKNVRIETQNLFLTQKCNEQMVEIMLKILMIGSQNKDSDIANYYISSFAYLLNLNPSNSYLIFDKILIDTYDSLAEEFINSRHRIIASLKQFTRVVRYMVIDKLYRIHVMHVLSLMIQKIDMNDMNLTSNLINGIVSIATFIPLECPLKENEFINFESNAAPLIEQHFMFLKNGGNSSDFKYDEKLLSNAFRGSTTILKGCLKMYIDKLFQLVDVEIEGPLCTKINQTTMIMIESMDDSSFKYFADYLLRIYWDNDAFREKEPNYEIICTPLAALVKRNNKLSKGIITTLIFNIKQQIERGAGSVRSSSEIQSRDVKLVLFLNTMNDVLRQSHEAVIELKDELLPFMKFVYKNITNPPLDVITSIMVHTTLTTLTTTELVESALFAANCKIPFEEKWGGLQFDSRKYDEENMNFKWYIPTQREIQAAIEIFDNMATWCMENIDSLLESSKSDTLHCDMIQKFILILTHALSGVSLLFDPDFTENKLKVTEFNPHVSPATKALILENFNSVKWDEEDSIDGTSRENTPDFKGKDINVTTTPDFKDVLIFDGDNAAGETVSEIPSGICTPVQMGNDESREGSVDVNQVSISPEFRELDIFTCNYYFGNTFQEKLQHKHYFEIHKMRSKVGTFLHKMYEFIKTYHENNTIMNQILLHGVKVFFTDVGQETIFNNDSNAFLEGDFLDNIQSLAHMKEPYTRMFFAVKVNELHQNRVLLHSSNRYPSKLETTLLKDMITLSTSLYPDVHNLAQGTMTHCMKQIIGSYPMIVKSLINLLSENLKEGNNKKLEVIIKVLLLKKIHRKLMSDFRNLQNLILLLIDCLKINDLNVSILAEKVLNDYVSGLKFPSSICIHDDKMFTPIAPPDAEVASHAKSVRLLKEHKRKYYTFLIQTLKDSLLGILNEPSEKSWRLVLIIIRFISRIESNLEMITDAKSISALFAQTETKHPDIVFLVARSLLSIYNKVFSLSDYKYDITKAYQNRYDPDFVKKMDTNIVGFNELFRKEMNNTASPNYYIDTPPFIGWLCWGRPMKVLTNNTVEISLQPNEIEIAQTLGNIISKEWLYEFSNTLIQDNESRTVFSTGDVSFFVLVIILFAKKYNENVKLQDLFDLCDKYYDKYDKASMIMSIEIFAALISGGKYLSQKELQLRDDFANAYLEKCLNHELNQDSFEIWSTFCWWLPTLVDVRRCKPLLERFGNIKELFDINRDTVAHQASRIIMYRDILSGIGFRSPDMTDLLPHIKFDYPHDQIREAIAKLFSTITENECTPSLPNPETLMEKESNVDNGKGLGLPMKWVSPRLDKMIKEQFYEIEVEHGKLNYLTTQEILKSRYFYLSSTIFYWIEEMTRGPNKIIIIPYVAKYILPFLMKFLLQKDVCKLAGLDVATLFLATAYIPCRNNGINDVLDLMCNQSCFNETPSSYQLKLQIAFVQHYLSSQLLQLTEPQKEKIFDFIVSNIYNEQYVEVRDRAADVLSDIVHNIGDELELQKMIQRFSSKLDGFSWEEKQKLSKSDTLIHGSVIGLGSIISAFPYVFPLPRWIPQELSRLATWARTNGIAGVSAKNTIAEFKKVRTDTWHFDRTQFTNEELEDLEGVLWRSYYA
ncbi:proteasome activator Blm10p [Monosporozyma unispora]